MGPKPWDQYPKCQLLEGVPNIYCLEAVFGNILSVVVTLAGIALFIMLTVGAVRFLVSGGEPKAVETARKTMTSALIGIVLIISSFLILKLLANFTGIDLLKFDIPDFTTPTPTP